MSTRETTSLLSRLSCVDSEIVSVSRAGERRANVNRAQTDDLLWEAFELTLEITRQLCETDRVWADLDTFAYIWRRLPELVNACRRIGIITIGISDVVEAAHTDSQRLFHRSEVVDDCQIDLLSDHENEETRQALLDAVDRLQVAGDKWFVHAFSSRNERYFDAGYALLAATDRRCIKERDALIAQ